jgi:hypothetical protein
VSKPTQAYTDGGTRIGVVTLLCGDQRRVDSSAAVEGRSPYPDTAAFIDAETSGATEAIKNAVDEGRAVVLAYADGSTRVLRAEPVPR